MDILTKCFGCDKKISDFADLCFTKLSGQPAAVALCAECGHKRGLKTVAEIAERKPD